MNNNQQQTLSTKEYIMSGIRQTVDPYNLTD